MKAQNKFEINRFCDFSDLPGPVISKANGCHNGGSLPGIVDALVRFDR